MASRYHRVFGSGAPISAASCGAVQVVLSLKSMRLGLIKIALGFGLAATGVLACTPAQPPPEIPVALGRAVVGARRVVPADQVKGTCKCDDDDDADEADADDEQTPRRRSVEYVKLRDWQPPPSVEELEASLPSRGPQPQSFTTFPPLTLHRPIGGSSTARWGRGMSSGFGNSHAR